MTHAGLPVSGYRPQSSEAVDLVNQHKETEEQLLRWIEDIANGNLFTGADQRWLSIAKTHFEQGYMALNRAIFKPARIRLPGDVEESDDIPFI